MLSLKQLKRNRYNSTMHMLVLDLTSNAHICWIHLPYTNKQLKHNLCWRRRTAKYCYLMGHKSYLQISIINLATVHLVLLIECLLRIRSHLRQQSTSSTQFNAQVQRTSCPSVREWGGGTSRTSNHYLPHLYSNHLTRPNTTTTRHRMVRYSTPLYDN